MRRTGNVTARLGTAMALVLALAAFARVAAAQPAEMAEDESTRPWAKGVSQADQKEAMELFTKANALLRDALFVKAAEVYKEALTHWEHPAIYYNLALALINLDKPIELHDALAKAMRFGAAPLDEDKYRRAQNYQRLTEAQLAHVDISCDVPGTTVTMDGRELFKGPGNYEGLIPVGEHSIVATKPGYLTTNLPKVLKGGDDVKIAVKMYTVDDLTRYQRRWPRWQPWAVVGGGAAVAIIGGIMHASAKSHFDDFDAGVTACGGCTPSDDLSGKKSTGSLLQGMAVSAYVVGAAGIVTGAVMVYLNRGHSYRINPEDLERPVTVVPTVGPESAGVLARINF